MRRLAKYVLLLTAIITLCVLHGTKAAAAELTASFGSEGYATVEGETFPIGVYLTSNGSVISEYTVKVAIDPEVMTYVEGATEYENGVLTITGAPYVVRARVMLQFTNIAVKNTKIRILEVAAKDYSGREFTIVEPLPEAPVYAPVTPLEDSVVSEHVTLSQLTLNGVEITDINQINRTAIAETYEDEELLFTTSDGYLLQYDTAPLGVGTHSIRLDAVNTAGEQTTYTILLNVVEAPETAIEEITNEANETPQEPVLNDDEMVEEDSTLTIRPLDEPLVTETKFQRLLGSFGLNTNTLLIIVAVLAGILFLVLLEKVRRRFFNQPRNSKRNQNSSTSDEFEFDSLYDE